MERQLYAAGLGPVAGVDEAGRGACCGPMTIAACILPFHVDADSFPSCLAGLQDSKKLTPRRREALFDSIVEEAVSYSIVMISAADIDRWGVQHANVSGMRRAVALLDTTPGYVLTDAVKIPGLAQPHLPVLKGDQMAASISAASILAKVARDRHMIELDAEYPEYGLAGHKGYGTKTHMAAVSLHGGTPEHRYTYKNVAHAHALWSST
ncbi:ribonuclease HII [Corynebacterium sp. zg254]|uniref:Ribonuclease HII n=1 Tax=Corynebacterium zhongnanshanii TaxID=2768834 RepID=A0ABQ6VH55_9CORY|nr:MULTISPECIES: ribonuclease HII [Corynebacterium]KAB3523658.1 ribonuclease HII [Corynebacterium zhongnanshanii]MCR5913554.1 ribonuclease HII [Corynebacterium sp. zg254]